MSIVAAFDLSGHSVRPWAIAGAKCFCLDNAEYVLTRATETFESGGSIEYIKWDATSPDAARIIRDLKPHFLISMAPCTDLTVAGARHFESKHTSNPAFWLEANAKMILGKMAEIPAWRVEDTTVYAISKSWMIM